MDKIVENLKKQLKEPTTTTQEDGKETSSYKRKCSTIGHHLISYFTYK
jgi:hypothetical protein